jgi:DNA-directed RNA polymerase subunit K/omega
MSDYEDYVASSESESEPEMDEEYAFGGKESDSSQDEAASESESEQSDDEVDVVDEKIDLSKISDYNKEIVAVKPENHCTSNILSRYEMAEIISIRATQISQHNNCCVDITGLDNPTDMAKRELMMRMNPLVLRRHVGDLKNAKTGNVESYYEMKNPNEMQFSVTYNNVM